MGESSSQTNASNSHMPSSSSSGLDSDVQPPISGVVADIDASYSPTLSSDTSPPPPPPPPSRWNTASNIAPVASSSSHGHLVSLPDQQEALLSTVNNATHAGAPNALSPAPNGGGSNLQMAQQHDDFDIADVHSHTISPVSGALLAPSSSPSTSSSPSEHPTDPTASSSSSSRPMAIPEGGIDIPLPILLLWLVRNVSSAFFAELISRSFLLPNSDNGWTIQLLLETAVRHGVDDVHEFVERVFRGATELWELGYFVSAPTE
jgi:hypothetical protein